MDASVDFQIGWKSDLTMWGALTIKELQGQWCELSPAKDSAGFCFIPHTSIATG
jgi:hypothetical protein